MIKFKTDRLTIRDPQGDDISQWHRLISDPETMYYLQDILTASPQESRKSLEQAMAQAASANRREYFFAVLETDTNAFAGSVGYTVEADTPAGKIAHAGYFLLPEFHGRGYAAEALSGIMRYAFTQGGVVRLQTGCITENRASERVMQKCGMKKEAARKACVWHDGRLKDRVEYRMLKTEWEENVSGTDLPGAPGLTFGGEPARHSSWMG